MEEDQDESGFLIHAESMVNYLSVSNSSINMKKNKAKPFSDSSYPIIGKITGDDSFLWEGEEDVRMVLSDCDVAANPMQVTYAGIRDQALDPITESKVDCARVVPIVRYDSEELMGDFPWDANLCAPEPSAPEKKEPEWRKWKEKRPKEESDYTEELTRSAQASETRISRKKFDCGVLYGLGQVPVQVYTIANSWIEVDVLDYGATIAAIRVREMDRWTDIALGFDNLADYVSSQSHGLGGTVGRVTGHLEEGRFQLINEDGVQTVQLSRNNSGHHTDGGFQPLHKRLWQGMRCGDRLVMTVTCPDGEDGYPGNLQVWANFCLSGDCSLNLEYSAKCDAVSPVNITTGLAVNLAGHDAGAESIYDHSIFVNAEVCCDPLGESDKLGLVYQSPYDLTDLRHLGCVMLKEGRNGLDLTYSLYRSKLKKKDPLQLKPRANMIVAAVARHEASGRTMVLSTDQWGLRLHTCNKLAGVKGKGGAVYGKHSGLCLQPTELPNSIKFEHFPNIFVTPAEPYRQRIRYYFTTIKEDSPGKRMFCSHQPWLFDDVLLSCDNPPLPQEEKSEEIQTLYGQTYETLERLAEHKCSDNYEDNDGLSLHSSFTSFGSGEQEAPVDLVEEEELRVEEDSGGRSTVAMSKQFGIASDEAEETEGIVVKVDYPLLPFLTGKWPKPKPAPEIPSPAKKVCSSPPTRGKELSRIRSLKRSLTSPKPKKAESPDRSSELSQVNTVEPTMFTKVELGTVDRIPASTEIEKKTPEKLSIPDQLRMSDRSLVDELASMRNTLGEGCFQWFEPPQRLPWYCGGSGKMKNQEAVLSEDARRQEMGTFFKLVNFPEEYTDFEGTTHDLDNAVRIKFQCLKAHYNSISKAQTERKPCEMEK